MNNKKLMKKVVELEFQTLHSRQQSLRVMVQSAIICRAFGVKNNEIDETIKDYEREVVLSDNDIRKQYNEYVSFWEWAVNKNDMDKAKEFKDQLYYFIDGVRFFNENLANEFEQSSMVK